MSSSPWTPLGRSTGIDIENFEFSDVPFLRDITLGDVVGNVPFLANYSLVDLPKLAERLGALNRDLNAWPVHLSELDDCQYAHGGQRIGRVTGS